MVVAMDPAIALRRAFIDRFAAVCSGDDRVAAVFLSGSYAKDAADRFSDVDLIVVAGDGGYDALFADRWEIMASLGELVLAEDFDGFGRDMLLYLYADGVDGEVDLHHRRTVSWFQPSGLVTLVDKDHVAADVAPWPTPARSDRERLIARLLVHFWRQVWLGTGALARGRLLTRHGYLEAVRLCANLARLRADLTSPWAVSGLDKIEDALSTSEQQALGRTIVPLDERALKTGFTALVAFFELLAQELASRHDLRDPIELAAAVKQRLAEC